MSILSYPSDRDPSADYVSFTHRKYRTNSEAGVGGGAPAPPASGSRISLYMPNSTPAAAYGNTWAGTEFTGPLGVFQQMAGAALVNAGEGAVSNIADAMRGGDPFQAGQAAGSSIRDAATKFGNQIMQNQGELVEGMALQAGAMGAAAILPAFKSPNNLMAFTKGKIFNPNVELLYQGPNLRTFQFQFIFVPKSPTESRVVSEIIKQFKMWSAADDQGTYLEVPHVWDIVYGGIGGTVMNKFKPCALTNITVQDNAGSNAHTTFVDGTPTATSMTLAFNEVDYIYRKDHEQHERGF